MWLAKGILVGLLCSFIFTLIYWTYSLWPPRPNSATGVSVIYALILYRPLYWATFGLVMTTCCFCARLLHMALQRHSPV
jgi:hypothetical protein